ncbi:MAG: EF-hand domain-containing protein [Candidatus Omnitrophica bacterium]|jgi:Ca2+-binding EF-hand superfamily protein|nr:EF-hand domain-containing protein [Candidatus Omnitrophota bacterium]MDD5506527.1 EF-hand domain-containing protein [Candidatus Omnitrophota bacterium]
MKNLKLAGVFSCVFSLLACGDLIADQAGAPLVKAEFKAIDANKNGYITAEEIQAHQDKNFNALDKDKDGAVDSREISADKTRILEKSDKNKDGKVTRQESSAQFREYFREMDADKDNRVSEDEYTDYWKMRLKF